MSELGVFMASVSSMVFVITSEDLRVSTDGSIEVGSPPSTTL